jgi:hypothetical protein
MGGGVPEVDMPARFVAVATLRRCDYIPKSSAVRRRGMTKSYFVIPLDMIFDHFFLSTKMVTTTTTQMEMVRAPVIPALILMLTSSAFHG